MTTNNLFYTADKKIPELLLPCPHCDDLPFNEIRIDRFSYEKPLRKNLAKLFLTEVIP